MWKFSRPLAGTLIDEVPRNRMSETTCGNCRWILPCNTSLVSLSTCCKFIYLRQWKKFSYLLVKCCSIVKNCMAQITTSCDGCRHRFKVWCMTIGSVHSEGTSTSAFICAIWITLHCCLMNYLNHRANREFPITVVKSQVANFVFSSVLTTPYRDFSRRKVAASQLALN